MVDVSTVRISEAPGGECRLLEVPICECVMRGSLAMYYGEVADRLADYRVFFLRKGRFRGREMKRWLRLVAFLFESGLLGFNESPGVEYDI